MRLLLLALAVFALSALAQLALSQPTPFSPEFTRLAAKLLSSTLDPLDPDVALLPEDGAFLRLWYTPPGGEQQVYEARITFYNATRYQTYGFRTVAYAQLPGLPNGTWVSRYTVYYRTASGSEVVVLSDDIHLNLTETAWVFALTFTVEGGGGVFTVACHPNLGNFLSMLMSPNNAYVFESGAQRIHVKRLRDIAPLRQRLYAISNGFPTGAVAVGDPADAERGIHFLMYAQDVVDTVVFVRELEGLQVPLVEWSERVMDVFLWAFQPMHIRVPLFTSRSVALSYGTLEVRYSSWCVFMYGAPSPCGGRFESGVVIEEDGSVTPSYAPVERYGDRYAVRCPVLTLTVKRRNAVVDALLSSAYQVRVQAENVTLRRGVAIPPTIDYVTPGAQLQVTSNLTLESSLIHVLDIPPNAQNLRIRRSAVHGSPAFRLVGARNILLERCYVNALISANPFFEIVNSTGVVMRDSTALWGVGTFALDSQNITISGTNIYGLYRAGVYAHALLKNVRDFRFTNVYFTVHTIENARNLYFENFAHYMQTIRDAVNVRFSGLRMDYYGTYFYNVQNVVVENPSGYLYGGMLPINPNEALYFEDCRNVTVKGGDIRRAGENAVKVVRCRDVRIQDASLTCYARAPTDECNRGVWVEDSRNVYLRRVLLSGLYTRNVTFVGNTIAQINFSAFLIGYTPTFFRTAGIDIVGINNLVIRDIAGNYVRHLRIINSTGITLYNVYLNLGFLRLENVNSSVVHSIHLKDFSGFDVRGYNLRLYNITIRHVTSYPMGIWLREGESIVQNVTCVSEWGIYGTCFRVYGGRHLILDSYAYSFEYVLHAVRANASVILARTVAENTAHLAFLVGSRGITMICNIYRDPPTNYPYPPKAVYIESTRIHGDLNPIPSTGNNVTLNLINCTQYRLPWRYYDPVYGVYITANNSMNYITRNAFYNATFLSNASNIWLNNYFWNHSGGPYYIPGSAGDVDPDPSPNASFLSVCPFIFNIPPPPAPPLEEEQPPSQPPPQPPPSQPPPSQPPGEQPSEEQPGEQPPPEQPPSEQPRGEALQRLLELLRRYWWLLLLLALAAFGYYAYRERRFREGIVVGGRRWLPIAALVVVAAAVGVAVLAWRTVYVIVEITVTEGGTTDPKPGKIAIPKCSDFSVRAIPYEGYAFLQWVVNSTNVYYENPITLHICAQTHIHAIFVEAPLPQQPEQRRLPLWLPLLVLAAAALVVGALLWRRRSGLVIG